jgi:hypothetical protein
VGGCDEKVFGRFDGGCPKQEQVAVAVLRLEAINAEAGQDEQDKEADGQGL